MDKTLLFKAAEAAQGITAAQTAIEDRKRAVEEAKAAVETAKADLVEAKSAYDAVIAEFVASGVPASKVKRNVEDFLRILGDLGFVEAQVEDAPPAAEPKAPRRKKAEATVPAEVAEGAAKLEEAVEPGVIVLQDEKSDATVSEPVDVSEETAKEDEAPIEAAPEAEVVEERVVDEEPEAQPQVKEASQSESQTDDAAEEAFDIGAEIDVAIATDPAYDEIDNTEAFTEILDLIETITAGEAVAVSETLVTLLNAADWFSREWEKQPLDVQFYRDILNLEFVESALKERMGDDLRSALVAVQGDAESIRILEWFASALDRVEAGSDAGSYSEFAAASVDEIGAETEAADAGANVEPDVAELAAQVDPVSDDARLVGETVEDIGEINFLEDAASVFAGATVESVTTEAPKPAQSETAKPGEARSFRPRFLGAKG